MQNGDRYNGKVLSLDDKTLVLENDVLGKITLPRIKLAAVFLGPRAAQSATNSAPISGLRTNAFTAELASHSNLIQQVQRKFLSGADPAAQQKFDQLVSGLLNGSITVEDLQKEARTTLDQVRALKKDLGPDAGFALDGYLAILEQFLKEASPAPTSAGSNAIAPKTTQ